MAALFAVMCAGQLKAKSYSYRSVIVNNTDSTQYLTPYVSRGLPLRGVRSAVVSVDDSIVPTQLDDMDGDGCYDELCFMATLPPHCKKVVKLVTSDEPPTRQFAPRTYAEIVLRNPKVKEKNKHDIYLNSISLSPRTANPYNVLHHHGVAFENELIAIRIYMDPRQTVDLYGKYHKRLELQQTQFYTSKEQKQQGYGDDVLWVGNSFGLGALREYHDNQICMLDTVESRTQRIISAGPVRTVVEMSDNQWHTHGGQLIHLTERFTLYAGRRDVKVDVCSSEEMPDGSLCTGLVNIKKSTEYNNHLTTRGCWGTDWPASDTANWKRETLGLGIYVPRQFVVKQLEKDKLDYTTLLKMRNRHLCYYITYSSDDEDFGYHSSESWFSWLQAWSNDLQQNNGLEHSVIWRKCN